MKVKIYNQKGEGIKDIDLPAEIFDVEINNDLIHQAVVAQMANARQVIAHTKDRSEVSGGGRKPWRQKGTGRARHGSIRSPIWRGGGVTFGPTKERVFSKKINKKMKKKALFMAMTSKLKDEEMILLDKIEVDRVKTKEMVKVVKNLTDRIKKDLVKGALIVLPKSDEKIVRVSKNIPKMKTIRADSLNVVDVLTYKYLVIIEPAIEVIKKTYI